MRFVLALLLALAAALSVACGDVKKAEQLTAAQKQQLTEDPALGNLINENYLPTELRTQEGESPQILLVHQGDCDRPPYCWDFPAVLIDIAKVPTGKESVSITRVTLITRRYAPGDVCNTRRYCTEPLTSLPTLQELREVIGKLAEDGSIGPNDRLDDRSWQCDFNN